MPVLETQQLIDAIKDGKVEFITLDTNVFHASEYNLMSKKLTSLKQFDGTKIKFIFTDVVENEVKNHIKNNNLRSAEKLVSAERQYFISLKINPEQRIYDKRNEIFKSAIENASNQLDNYKKITNYDILNSNTVSAKTILDMYFKEESPFESKSEKKNEFPDAIALMTLEHKASTNETYILAISKDKGWKDYSINSKHIIVIENLNDALNIFNSEDGFLARSIMASFNRNKSDIRSLIYSNVEYYAQNIIPNIDAQSDYRYEENLTESELVRIDNIDLDSISVLSSEDEEITISFDLNCTFSLSWEFDFYVDAESEEINIGSGSAEKELDIKLEVAITTNRDPNDIELLDIEIESSSNPYIDLGYIEIDYDL